MTKDEFIKIFSENPNDDRVLAEVNRLYDSETMLTADFASADSERTQLKADLDAANRRYRERFLKGPEDDKHEQNNEQGEPPTIDSLFKE